MAYCVKEKLPKVKAEGFMRYPANWLIVYDNWPVPAVDYAKASAYVVPLLAEMGALTVFDAIFIHDTAQMCEFQGTLVIHTLLKPRDLARLR